MTKKSDPVQEKIAELIKDIEARIGENNKTISKCTAENKENKRMLKELKKLSGKGSKVISDEESNADNQDSNNENMTDSSTEKVYPAPQEISDEKLQNN